MLKFDLKEKTNDSIFQQILIEGIIKVCGIECNSINFSNVLQIIWNYAGYIIIFKIEADFVMLKFQRSL